MPRISVIVPVYKVEKYIRCCIDSILGQTFTDFELILVDDGSPDNCPAICDEYAAKDSRVKVVHQQNRGLSAARNAGIDCAAGRYICFVDSDDMVAPTYCETLLKLLEGSEADFSFCAVCRFPDGEEPQSGGCEETGTVTNEEFLRMQFDRQTEFGTWNKLFRRELFENIRYLQGKIHEDVIFSADLARNLSRGVAYTGQQLYFYRQRESGIVAAQSVKCSADRVFAGEYLLQVAEEKFPKLLDRALRYGVEYPWMFVDPIYVKRTFRENRAFLNALQACLKKNMGQYQKREIFSEILLKRMRLFSKSRLLYGFNAYARLFRVYLYRLIGKDAYRDGHGI